MLTSPRSYGAPINTAMGTDAGVPVMSLGYQLSDGSNGKAAGMYDPVNRVPSLKIANVSLTGATSAKVFLDATFNQVTHTPDATWGWKYRGAGSTESTLALGIRELCRPLKPT